MNSIRPISILITIVILALYSYYGIWLASGDFWTNLSRSLVLFAIGWFSYRTIVVFLTESINEKNHQGSIPILAIVYTLASLIFFYFFYYSFEEILQVCRYKILSILNYSDNQELYLYGINILTSFALIAFSFNMMKAIFTLNSLEFGLIYNSNLKEVFNGKKNRAFIESLFRFLIAIAFIILENKLNTTSDNLLQAQIRDGVKHIEPTNFLLLIGCWISTLYLLLLIWLGIIFKFLDKESKLKNDWYKNSFWQFLLGLIIGIVFIALGSPLEKEFYLISLMAGIIFCFLLVYFIIKIELIHFKNGASNSI